MPRCGNSACPSRMLRPAAYHARRENARGPSFDQGRSRRSCAPTAAGRLAPAPTGCSSATGCSGRSVAQCTSSRSRHTWASGPPCLRPSTTRS
eukprot:3438707-Prymnesium_polylepis.1